MRSVNVRLPLRRIVLLSLATAVVFAAASEPGMAAAPFVTKRCTARERARFQELREHAVVKGTAWMAAFLESPDNLKGLGTDAPVIFLAGQNARSATIRNLSLPLARYEAGQPQVGWCFPWWVRPLLRCMRNRAFKA